MDKSEGRIQILNGHLFYSPNCSRTVDYPPPLEDVNGCLHNIFLPDRQSTGRRNFFELDIAEYAVPRWWSLAFGWIAFLPLYPSFTGPIFEKLIMPGNPLRHFDEETHQYFMSPSLRNKWLQVDRDLLDAVHIIRCHYDIAFVYPLQPSGFGFSKAHPSSGALHMSLRRSRDWFVVWMALLSFVIAHAQFIYPTLKDSVNLAQTHWCDLILLHFNHQWLDTLLASTVCSFSPYTPRAGVFLDLSVHDSNQPPPEFYCQSHVPVWYCWTMEMANQPKFAHLAPLLHQLQEGATIISKSPRAPTHPPLPPASVVSPQPPAVSSSRTKSVTWAEFLTRRQKRYDERVQKETPQQRQVRLGRLHNPPKISAKVFEWVENDNGDLFREAVSKKMREDVLADYPARQIYYDPIENEYDCCREYDSGAPGEASNDYDNADDTISWGDSDVGEGQLGDDRVLVPRAPSPGVEIDDNWDTPMAPDPMSPDNFTAEVHHILDLYFGYTPIIPIPQFTEPVLRSEADMRRFVRFLGIPWKGLPLPAFGTDQISAAATFIRQLYTKGSSLSVDVWDVSRENRHSVFFSARLKAVRSLGDSDPPNLFMFDFKEHSTVKWKLTVTTPMHALVVCRIDPQLDETGLAIYLLENGIPFHTLQLSTTLSRSPPSTHPPLVLPSRNADYVFSLQDYENFRQQCHVIFKQPRGRAALLRGYYPWRLAMNDVGFSSVLSGPSGLSTNPEEMLIVKVPETGEEFIDDKLTDVELRFICGQYVTSTSMSFISGSFQFY
jgi:hypothetical protein